MCLKAGWSRLLPLMSLINAGLMGGFLVLFGCGEGLHRDYLSFKYSGPDIPEDCDFGDPRIDNMRRIFIEEWSHTEMATPEFLAQAEETPICITQKKTFNCSESTKATGCAGFGGFWVSESNLKSGFAHEFGHVYLTFSDVPHGLHHIDDIFCGYPVKDCESDGILKVISKNL